MIKIRTIRPPDWPAIMAIQSECYHQLEPEPLEVIPWPLNRIDELLARPDFTESRSISALLLACKWLAEQES